VTATSFDLMSQPPSAEISMSETVARIISHDLKNPLAGIAGALQLIGETDDAALPREVLLAEVRERVADLTRILDDLVALGRAPDLLPSPLSVAQFVRDAVGDAFSQRGWHAGVNIEGEDLTVHCDPECLERIVVHLVQNAVEAMDGVGTVNITILRKGSRCLISVGDSGPGFTADQLERCFEPRFTTKPAHPGLGLAVARYLAQQLGGEVVVEPRRRNGAEVRLELPL
jgi:signal transduction histidine kinase